MKPITFIQELLSRTDNWLRAPKAVYTPIIGIESPFANIRVFWGWSLLFLGIFGLSLGIFHSWQMSLLSAIKMPLLFIATLLICLPALYIFNLIFGQGFKYRDLVLIYLMGLSLMAIVAASLVPVGFFFVFTGCHYHFYTFINLVFLLFAGLIGLKRFIECGKYLASVTRAEFNVGFLIFTFLLTGFVGLQLGWTLRPFIGDPERPFNWFRYRDVHKNLYVQQWRNLMERIESCCD